MRVTVNVPDKLARDLKIHAEGEQKSVSSVVTEFIACGIKNSKKTAAKNNILQMAGKTGMDKRALGMLDKMRSEDDRF